MRTLKFCQKPILKVTKIQAENTSWTCCTKGVSIQGHSHLLIHGQEKGDGNIVHVYTTQHMRLEILLAKNCDGLDLMSSY